MSEELFDVSKLKITPVEINQEMRKAYIDYSVSVLLGRALPDVRDGLKPVHRRILYTMYEAGLTPDKPYKKCATTVGDVLGKYHPHGDASVYDALVRMAQDFSLRYPMVDGHGNFGSVDGDPAAAYRYTEARMAKLSLNMLTDIDKETVDFMPNYDESRKEPVVLPSRFPYLLVNGSNGIAVGMATNIPPHNLTEVIDGVVALIDNPDMEIDEIMDYIKGPDFPTGAKVMGMSGIRAAYHTGRGKIKMRARAEVEDWKENRQRIVITEIPYMVNKARLIEKMAELVHEKRVEGISDIRDESDREGMRIVVELKRDVNGTIVLNQLYKYTQLEDTFGINMIAVVDGTPRTLNLKEILTHYIKFQEDVVTRRTVYEKKKAEARAHILEGLITATDNIDEVINIIRSTSTIPLVKERLIERFGFSDVQVQAIVTMQLGRLAGMEREKIQNEYAELTELIARLTKILSDEKLVLQIVKDEIIEIRDKFGDDRRTSLEPAEDDIDIEDLIEEEENVITLTHIGYVKRLSTDTYHSQRRGGKGIMGLQTKEEDFVSTMLTASTHAHILFFTDRGRIFSVKAYQIPETGRQAKGMPIVNLIPLEAGEKVQAMLPVREYKSGYFLTFATRGGIIKKTDLMEYEHIPKGGKIAIKLDDGDELIRVELTDGTNDVFLGTHGGKMIRFNEKDVRATGRASRGVRGIMLQNDDYVVGMALCRDDSKLLVVSEGGYGKKTDIGEYKIQSRGGKGVTSYKISDDTRLVAGFDVVSDDKDVMLITSEGVIIRIDTRDISTFGRATKGVRLMRLPENVNISSIALTERTDEESEPEQEE